ncbi:MAG: hypothetical protein UY71_C0023G0003 [Parcubacteria group bacterium GW2011_GWB1_52_7]|nr:MAG: hypothetical protein UY64_C0001G0037 [Parcubacteria group bacterium GW2011_GWA1_51_12]KKW28382.1 MAG: hypothetical protein UY71_C0023G0003 [Parcubacteria group bacterium GW2011_GWB1_52_7]KKW31287.1 MAG: hypothetical protein UY75_C0011G0012 [Parcubacteria group bacterium GW2011_GWC2_52_8c]HCQ63625.1 hypothetical protein [Candidatus Azambacteria bacterium]
MYINQQIVVIGIAAVGLLLIGLAVVLFDLRQRFMKLFAAAAPESHAELLTQILHRAEIAERDIASLRSRAEALEKIASRSFQKIGFMRFNPFADTGGDQSFALALLDHENNGIVVSSLYNREGTRIYAKAIDHGTPKQALSEEEKEVLERAINKN